MTNKELLTKWYGKVFAIEGIGDVCILAETTHFGAPDWYVNSINKNTPAITIEIKYDDEFNYVTISYNELARAVEVDKHDMGLTRYDSFNDLNAGSVFQLADLMGGITKFVVIAKHLDEVFCYYANSGNARAAHTTILTRKYIEENDNFKILEL